MISIVRLFSLIGISIVVISCQKNDVIHQKLSPEKFLANADIEAGVRLHGLTIAQWNQSANITEENSRKLIEANKEYDQFRRKQFEQIATYDYAKLEPINVLRQFQKLALLGTSALEPSDSLKFQELQLGMENIYSMATIEVDGRSQLTLEPDLTNLMANSTDEALLKQIWVKWRDATGAKMRQNYIDYYKLGNKAAQMNKVAGKVFNTFDDLSMFSWETDNLKTQIDDLMRQTMPIYKKIHAYVRYHLNATYPEAMPADGTIPAHLLGNMWAQQWSNVLNTIKELNPHTDVQPIDQEVNDHLSNWTVLQMFKIAEKFFHDLGMQNMTKKFYEKSILEKPTDRNLTCHASAWDFYDGNDFRIKQCTQKNMVDFITIHHEMGHIQYYMNYAKQRVVFRDGANPGFHEAIGDLIALSVSTPEHLAKLGLLQKQTNEIVRNKINLNYQLKMALEKIVFLPFAYVMDKWRWDVFGNPSMEAQLNRHWWTLRLQHQGISPPTKRSENDFDPGAKYHIPAGVEYVRYFVSHILQFQFYEHMCSFVANVTELYKCDFDGNQQAGESLIRMLRKGSSDSWQNILRKFIGTESMRLSSLERYFEPLNRYLDEFIHDHQIVPGWSADVNNYMITSGSAALFQGMFNLVGVIALILFSSSYLFSFCVFET